MKTEGWQQNCAADRIKSGGCRRFVLSACSTSANIPFNPTDKPFSHTDRIPGIFYFKLRSSFKLCLSSKRAVLFSVVGGFLQSHSRISAAGTPSRAFPEPDARSIGLMTLPGFAEGDPVAELWDRHSRSVLPESKATCAVLEAVAEILQQQRIAPSPTAVFAATLSSMERAAEATPVEQTVAMLTVLATALEHAPPAPVLSRLPACAKVLMSAGRAAQESPRALQGVVRCIGLLVSTLRAAPSEQAVMDSWEHCGKPFTALSNLCADGRPKVRKQAAAAVAETLRALRDTPAAVPAGRAFAEVAVKSLRAPGKAARELHDMHGTSGAKQAEIRAQACAAESLFVLETLKRIIGELREPAAGEVAGAVVGLLDLAEPMLTQHACDVLVLLFAQTGATATAAAANAAAVAVASGGFGVAPAQPYQNPAARATAAAAIAPLASAAAAEAARRPTLAVSLTRAHAAAVRRLHELDPADLGARAVPTACHELVKMLNAVHEGVAMEAAGCLSMLVTRCVDANMVREGIKAVAAARAEGREAPARPPPAIGVATALRQSLGFRYRAAWPVALPVVATAFDRLGAAGGPILGGCLKALGEMGAHAEGLQCRTQLSATLGAAVRALGPEQVLAVLPLRLEEGIDAEIAAKRALGDGVGDDGMDEDGNETVTVMNAELDEHGGNIAGKDGARLWLVPLLRQALCGARVSYFAEELLPTARRLGQRASKAKASGRVFEAQRCAAAESALWSLLPAFCRWPEDTADSFASLAPSLGSALSARPDLRGPLTEALRRLIRQALACQAADGDGDEDLHDDDDDDDLFDEEDVAKKANELAVTLEDRPDWFTLEVAKGQLAAVAAFSRNFLPILFNLFVSSPADRRGELAATVGAFAQITDSNALGGFFRTVLKKLVKVTADADDAADKLTEGGATKSQRRCTFMDLVLAMVSGLDLASRELVFKAARPASTEKDAAVQKRAYKLLAALMRTKRTAGGEPGENWLAANREVAERTLIAGSGNCAPAARRYRLRCVAAILPSLMERENQEQEAQQENSAAVSSETIPIVASTMSANGGFATLLGELIVATKETNARTRVSAFKLLVDIPRAMERRAGRSSGGGGKIRGGSSGGGGGMLGAWLAEGAVDDENDEEEEDMEADDDEDMDGDDVTPDDSEMGAGVRRFFLTVLAGVVGASPTMQSASVMALARLLYEFSAALVTTVPELLPAIYALLETGDREVVKACLGFAKVVAVRLPQVELAAKLSELVPALLKPCDDDDGFARFKGKTRVVIERLVKRCGWKAVEDVTPALHARLLQHMRREEMRNEKKRKAASLAGSQFGGKAGTEAGRSARTGRKSAWNAEDVFSEGDDDGDNNRLGRNPRSAAGGKGAYSVAASRRDAGDGGARSAAAAHARRAVGGARLPGAAAGDTPLDLLDDSAMRRNLLGSHRKGVGFEDDDGAGGYKRGEGGRLLIVEERHGGKRKRGDDDEQFDDARSLGARSNVSRARTAKTRGTARSCETARTDRTGRSQKTDRKNGKTAKGENKHAADAYRAKKGAKGDVRDTRRTLEPYAYWPLDPKLLNRRASKRATAKDGLASVVRNAKAAGIVHGQKAKDQAR